MPVYNSTYRKPSLSSVDLPSNIMQQKELHRPELQIFELIDEANVFLSDVVLIFIS